MLKLLDHIVFFVICAKWGTRCSVSKLNPLYALKCLHVIIEPIRASRAHGESLLRGTLSIAALFLVLGDATAEDGAGRKPSYNSAELEQQASEWDSLRVKAAIARAKQERARREAKQDQQRAAQRNERWLRPLFDKSFPEKEAFGAEPPMSWMWWDDHSMSGKALRGRLIRWLRASPFMKDASDLNLWFVVQLLESTARLGAKVEALEANSPNNTSFAAGFGPGSERERFALWTGCKPLWPVLFLDPKDDMFEDSVRGAVESRLRGTARLYGGTANGELLRVMVSRGRGLFSISVGLQKRLFDPVTRLRSHAYGDYRGGAYSSFGSGPPEYIRSVLADHVDRFIADYLRVNADACNGPLEPSK